VIQDPQGAFFMVWEPRGTIGAGDVNGPGKLSWNELASPDVDVILGDGPHVVQPVAKINGKWVVYSPGNQISRHADPVDESREGVMPKFTFTEMTPHHFRITRAEAVPTWMDISPKLRLIDLPVALADPATSAQQRITYQHAYDQITAYLDADGARRNGFVVDR